MTKLTKDEYNVETDKTVFKRSYGKFICIYLHGRLKHVYYYENTTNNGWMLINPRGSQHEGMVINILYPKIKKNGITYNRRRF